MRSGEVAVEDRASHIRETFAVFWFLTHPRQRPELVLSSGRGIALITGLPGVSGNLSVP